MYLKGNGMTSRGSCVPYSTAMTFLAHGSGRQWMRIMARYGEISVAPVTASTNKLSSQSIPPTMLVEPQLPFSSIDGYLV